MRTALFFGITTFVLSSAAFGQADLILLNNSNQQSEQVEVRTSDSSGPRYTTKPRPKPLKPTPAPTPQPSQQPVTVEPDPQKDLERATTLPAVAPDPSINQDKSQNGNMLEQARDFVMGGPPEVLDEYHS